MKVTSRTNVELVLLGMFDENIALVIPAKRFLTSSDIHRSTGIPIPNIRYWESRYPKLRSESASLYKRRRYRREDFLLIFALKTLTVECGFSLEGALCIVDLLDPKALVVDTGPPKALSISKLQFQLWLSAGVLKRIFNESTVN